MDCYNNTALPGLPADNTVPGVCVCVCVGAGWGDDGGVAGFRLLFENGTTAAFGNTV